MDTIRKLCPDCQQEKFHLDFYTKGPRLESICKECSLLRKKEQRLAVKKINPIKEVGREDGGIVLNIKLQESNLKSGGVIELTKILFGDFFGDKD